MGIELVPSCPNPQCQKPLGGLVNFCPFCGESTSAARPLPVSEEPPSISIEDHVQPEPIESPVVPNVIPSSYDLEPSLSPHKLESVPRQRRNRIGWAGVAVFLLLGLIFFLQPSRQRGSIVVTTNPLVKGQVLLDGQPVGEIGAAISAPVGHHELGLSADGWNAESVGADVKADETATVIMQVTVRPVFLTVEVDPAGAAVEIDGRSVGRAPQQDRVPPGLHHILATDDGYETKGMDVRVAVNENKTVRIVLGRVQTRRIKALPGSWSPPLSLPSRSRFYLSFSGKLRIRIGGKVYFVDDARSIDLGETSGATLEIKSAEGHPIDVEVMVKQGP